MGCFLLAPNPMRAWQLRAHTNDTSQIPPAPTPPRHILQVNEAKDLLLKGGGK